MIVTKALYGSSISTRSIAYNLVKLKYLHNLLQRERARKARETLCWQPSCTRGALIRRTRGNWTDIRNTLLAENAFDNTFRMDHDKFSFLAAEINERYRRDEKFGALSGGAIDIEVQLAIFLRFAAGGAYQDIKIAFGTSKSTVYAVFWRILKAIDALAWLHFKFFKTEEECIKAARGFEEHSTNGVINGCVGVADGLFVKVGFPALKKCRNRRRLYSGHKTGYGLNAQAICNANNEFIAFAIMAFGSMHDRRAWAYSKFDSLVEVLAL